MSFLPAATCLIQSREGVRAVDPGEEKSTSQLVSGVGPGLGREIASRVLRDGGNVVIGARKAESLEAAAQELDPSGERVLAHSFDITDEETLTSLSRSVRRAHKLFRESLEQHRKLLNGVLSSEEYYER